MTINLNDNTISNKESRLSYNFLGDINIESIYDKSYHCTRATGIRKRQYPVLSGSTERK